MRNIRELLKDIELHDSAVDLVIAKRDGSLEIILDLDEVWNKDLGSKINGIRLPSVYEISNYKIDRFNVIGTVDIQDIEDYNREFVTHCQNESNSATMVSIEFVAGGSLNIICSGSAEFLQCQV